MNPRRDAAPELQESEKRLLERFEPTATQSTSSGLHVPHGTKAWIIYVGGNDLYGPMAMSGKALVCGHYK